MRIDLDDVIAAVASPAGRAIRGIVRASGPGLVDVVSKCFRATDGTKLNDVAGPKRIPGRLRLADTQVDLPTALHYWPTRRSFTGQPAAEFHTFGSPPLLELIVTTLCRNGARPARPGEFTLRAFLAGRLDLTEAEAVLGVIDATAPDELDIALRQLAGGLSGRLATVRQSLIELLGDLEAGLDFVEEDIEFVTRDDIASRLSVASQVLSRIASDAGSRMTDATRPVVVLAGLPNAGKSSLFNALIGREQAVVSPIAGTTRDYLSAQITCGELNVEIVDTAGWEHRIDDLSTQAQTLRLEQLRRADLILWCVPADLDEVECQADDQLRRDSQFDQDRLLVVGTKCDVAASATGRDDVSQTMPVVSIHQPRTLADLTNRIGQIISKGQGTRTEMIGATAARSEDTVRRALSGVQSAILAAESGAGDEIVAAEIREALTAIAEMLGETYTDDILDVVFSKFCIGK
ncbi:tRNA modification GTPase [Stratiformator vulcanicus]|uniref:tRNA modification GTPase MnmE n=1 Tax=Stratiformator vulcanicus TaxID=2527980 RepID=A0A517R1X6_9PLAN|nr:tRNA modification GTPase [Stratiformator vulcanicus]QDT37889.1 tRNA modification GTPase MnmE [Stratiformator vulcanicus]